MSQHTQDSLSSALTLYELRQTGNSHSRYLHPLQCDPGRAYALREDAWLYVQALIPLKHLSVHTSHLNNAS